ncbi:MAG: type II toxin-antitoxin system VapC family toxin [Planctomycetota bacterium]
MNNAVIDASALIAFVKRERGFELVQSWLGDAAISAINFSECLQKLVDCDSEKNLLYGIISSFGMSIVEFDQIAAENVAAIFPIAKSGVSLADRACLALGRELNLPVITADRAWLTLNVGAEVICIREIVK